MAEKKTASGKRVWGSTEPYPRKKAASKAAAKLRRKASRRAT